MPHAITGAICAWWRDRTEAGSGRYEVVAGSVWPPRRRAGRTWTSLNLLLDEIAAIGPFGIKAATDNVPVLAELDPEVLYLGWEVLLESETDPSLAIDDVFLFLRDGMELSVEEIARLQRRSPGDGCGDRPRRLSCGRRCTSAAEATAAAPVAQKEQGNRPGAVVVEKPAASSSLRGVAAELPDELMDRVGELAIAQACSEARSPIPAATRAQERLPRRLERLSSGLRDTTMGIRMVPIGSIFRASGASCTISPASVGKEIEFITTGEETELDKTMIEKARRSAGPPHPQLRLDHGLEDAAVRVAKGKPARRQP